MKRYFEFVEGTSSKFWKIWMKGNVVTTRHGKIGSEGRETDKSFDDGTKAKAYYEKIIGEKTGKGYQEKK